MPVDSAGKSENGDIPSKGVLYIATGDEYVSEVFESVKTLKRETDLHCTLITDAAIEHELIDETLYGENPEHRPDNSYKLYHLHESPYDRTLFLDSDTYIDEDISGLFDALDQFDLGVTHAPVRNTDRLPELPSWFPEYNCGVMLYERNESVLRFFEQWRDNYEEMGFVQDQPSFRQTLFANDNLRYFTMLREYNVRFWPGYVDESVKIVHTHLDNEMIASELQAIDGPRVYYYDENEIVIKQNRKNVFMRAADLARRGRESIRENGIASTMTKGLGLLNRKL
jgi:hypothetical protein